MTIRDMAPPNGGIDYGAQEDEARDRTEETRAEQVSAEYWQHCEHRLWQRFLILRHYECLFGQTETHTWGAMADEIACLMRWPDFQEQESHFQELRAFVDVEGWPALWRCLARAMDSHEPKGAR